MSSRRWFSAVNSRIARSLARLACVLAPGFLLLSCTAPYRVAILEQPAQSFDGVLDFAADRDVRVLWIHGMCTHPTDWALERHQTFAAALGSTQTLLDIPVRPGPKRITFKDRVNNHQIETRYLLWSPLSAEAKKTLFFDAPPGERPGGQFEHTRAKFNNALKVGLINDCFADAVIYTGTAGNPIRRWVYQELCSALGGSVSGPLSCNVPNDAVATPLVAVSESLGSKILFDAVEQILSQRNTFARARMRTSLQLIFMKANQLPLLDTATFHQNVSPSTVLRVARMLTSGRGMKANRVTGRLEPPVRIVAFTDPNDLLSYRLPPEAFSPQNVGVSNVIVSNDDTYFGLIERPDTAHCGYAWNPFVLGTIVHGYDGALRSIRNDVPHKCGLAESDPVGERGTRPGY